MLGIFPLFFLYFLVTGLSEYIRVATFEEWLTALPGFLIILALFLLSGVPTWYILAGRTRVVLDLPHGRIKVVHDLRFYKRTRSFSIDQVKRVTVTPKRRGRPAITPYTYRIDLHLSDQKRIYIGSEDIVENARKVAGSLQKFLQMEPVSSSADRKDTA